jgi:MFS family permease
MHVWKSSASQTQEQANFHHLVLDIAWFGLALPATTRFLQIYAIRLGAGANELSLLTSLPAIILLLSASLGSRWMTRYHHETMRAIFWPALLFRLQFLLPAFTPFMPASFQPTWLILSLALPAIPQGLSNVVFLVMMREAVHDQHITPLTSQRSVALNIALGLSGLALGVWLEKAPFPFNYQSMFVLAFILALISMWHVMKIHCLPTQVIHKEETAVRINPWRSHKFQEIALIAAIIHIAFLSNHPLTPLHLIDNLRASESYMGVFALVELAAAAGLAVCASRIAKLIGNRGLIALMMVGTGAGSILLALTPNLGLALPAGALSLGAWTAATIGLFSYFSENTPTEGKAQYTVAYLQVISVATFIGPIIGSTLHSAGIDLVGVILVGGGLRLMSGWLTHLHTIEWVERARHYVSFSR